MLPVELIEKMKESQMGGYEEGLETNSPTSSCVI